MLKMNNVTIGYSRDKPIMENLNYEFKDDTFYCVLGESGKGKTTMLRTLAGLMKPLKGNIFYDGKLVNKDMNIYMMHQNYTAFNWWTVSKNVLISQEIHQSITPEQRKEALQIIKDVGLYKHIDKYPMQLSGGQRQRLALARMLFAKPDTILMDEPLSALDEETRAKMQQLIKDYQKIHKSTIVMVTHSEDEALALADKIIKL